MSSICNICNQNDCLIFAILLIKASITNYSTVSNLPIFDNSGTWQGPKFCDKDMAVCGIRVRVNEKQGATVLAAFDDTALNGAIFRCCPLPEAHHATYFPKGM